MVTGNDFILSVVIPVYNEFNTINKVIERVRSVEIPKEIIIVDDFSTDGTRELLQAIPESKDLKIFFHEKNCGKGAAIRTGFNHISGDVVVIQDADLEYDPVDYFRLMAPILKGKADVVYGSRFYGETHRVLYFYHFLGNRFLTMFSNFFTNLNLTDMETCYKMFTREVVEKLNLKSNRFGIEPELTAKVAKLKCRVYETGISYDGRSYGEGKKIGWKDGISAIYSIIRFWLFD